MKKLTVALVALLFGNFMQAQQVLTLKEALNFALENKAEAIKARLDVKNSEYIIAEVRASALPQINANGGLTYNAILQESALDFGGETQIIKMGRPWQSTASVSLNQQIFNQAVFTGLKAAKTTREFYQINAKLTNEQVIEKVATTYYELYKTKSQIETLDKTIANTTRVRDVIQSLYNSGLAKKIDLDRINVSLNNVVSSKQQMINVLELQENSLKYLIGMDISNKIELPDNTFEITSEAFVENANVGLNRTEIALLEKQGQLQELNLKATIAQGFPTLSLNANYGYLGIGGKMPWFQSYPQAYWSDFASIGLNLNIPIFNGGANRARIKQAKVDIEKFQADVNDAKLALNLDFENAKAQISNSLITMNTQKENVRLAKQVLDNVENNYKNGLATLTDLLEAETSYSNAQNNQTNALLDYKLAEVILIKAKGELDTLTK